MNKNKPEHAPAARPTAAQQDEVDGAGAPVPSTGLAGSSRPVHLYVYYKVLPAQREACVQASQTLLGQMSLFAEVHTELLERAEHGAAELTLMEALHSRPLSESGRKTLQSHFERLATAQFAGMEPPVHRHLEVFLPIEPVNTPIS